MMKRSILTTALLTVGTALLAAVPAHAGILDGSANNADVLAHIGLLNTNINSDVTSNELKNANTRAEGKGNNSIL
ncbi:MULTISPECIES: hypothetical protein [unclassified Streptomyces]|uniref:hypothetical protein n=1 Tax=unclassified Streptomyces TaxID=2593676 RepID=UPI00225271AF|nr:MULTISPECIES: hypothetical protein [unclassified Streptomyces]MCX4885130.1 hypothetical protein [Streptomyces sp. NBC_00847]MCX5425020.1 hypothetical protein [Streptomyces sp. NBC_00078]